MSFKKARRRGYLSYLVLLLFLIIFLLFSLFLSVSLGAVKINLLDTYRIVFSKLGWFSNIRYLSKSSIASFGICESQEYSLPLLQELDFLSAGV